MRRTRLSSSSSRGLCARQRFDLARVFYFTGLMVIVWRPGYRIDSRTIKGGSQVSSLFISFVENSNHCILGIIFLGYYLAFLYVSFAACGHLHDKLKFIKNGFCMHHLLCFRCWSFCRFFIDGGFTPLYHWHISLATSKDFYQS